MQEVTGSNPVSPTIDIKGFGRDSRPFFIRKLFYQGFQKNQGLGFPHRKILEYLAQQYDYRKKQYQEVHHSTIVRKCKLGKNYAKKYFNDLEAKGLIARRDDGYRVWYRIAI